MTGRRHYDFQGYYNVGAGCMRILIARRPWCGISFPPQPQQHLLEPSEVGGAGAGPGNSFALRVLEFNDVTDSLPSGPFCERRLKDFDEIRLLLPINISISSAIHWARRQRKGSTCFPGSIAPFWQCILRRIDRWQSLPWRWSLDVLLCSPRLAA